MITLEKIKEMYSNMKSNGIDITAVFPYRYFFLSNKKILLEKAIPDLQAMSFRIVDIYQPDDNWRLYVERIESHTAQSLFNLNKKLYAIAAKYKIEYDGYDLGYPERDTYVVREEFKGVLFTEEGFPTLLYGNTAFLIFPHKEEFKFFIKITTPYECDEKFMLPFDEEIDALGEFKDFMENNLTQNGIKNYYLMDMKRKGIMTLYFATSDDVGATEILKFIKEQGQQRYFEFDVIEDKDWKLYNDLRKEL